MCNKDSYLKPGEVLNDLLGFSNLSIIQHPDKFNFSLDSTLLANFATINKNTKRIIDLGTGNAPLPLFLSLRTTAHIDAVEIQDELYDIAMRNIEMNGLQSQVNIIHSDLKKIHKKLKNKYDLVICNPPFFKYTPTSNINKNDHLTIARHEVLATLDDVVCEASKLLKFGGIFTMVHRPDRLEDIFAALSKYKLSPKRMQLIYPRANKEANMVLIEAKNNLTTCGLKVLPPLVVFSGNEYSNSIKNLFGNSNKKPLIFQT